MSEDANYGPEFESLPPDMQAEIRKIIDQAGLGEDIGVQVVSLATGITQQADRIARETPSIAAMVGLTLLGRTIELHGPNYVADAIADMVGTDLRGTAMQLAEVVSIGFVLGATVHWTAQDTEHAEAGCDCPVHGNADSADEVLPANVIPAMLEVYPFYSDQDEWNEWMESYRAWRARQGRPVGGLPADVTMLDELFNAPAYGEDDEDEFVI